jgi:ABC-type uncharacterized transport system auxiliary subunit
MSVDSSILNLTQRILLFFLLVGVCCGCGASRPMKYYALDAGPAPAAPAGAQFPVVLLVSRVSSSHLYRDDRLVFGADAVQLGTYEYQRWAASPVDMVEDILVSSLRLTGRYRSVSAVGSNLRGDYILRSHLIALDEVDKPKLMARFSIQLELQDARAQATLWTDSYFHDEPVTGKKVSDVVEALDRNVRTGMQQLTANLGEYFTAHPPQTSGVQ